MSSCIPKKVKVLCRYITTYALIFYVHYLPDIYLYIVVYYYSIWDLVWFSNPSSKCNRELMINKYKIKITKITKNNSKH